MGSQWLDMTWWLNNNILTLSLLLNWCLPICFSQGVEIGLWHAPVYQLSLVWGNGEKWKWKLLSRVWFFVTPMDYTVHGILQAGVGSLALLQGIFPTQGSNPGLPHCRRILYQLSHQGSPRILEWVVYSFSRGSSRPRNRTEVSSIAGEFFTNWATRRKGHPSFWRVRNKILSPRSVSKGCQSHRRLREVGETRGNSGCENTGCCPR